MAVAETKKPPKNAYAPWEDYQRVRSLSSFAYGMPAVGQNYSSAFVAR